MTHEEILKRLQAKFPELGLTFGYIGNCGNNYDDRLWKYFTNVPMPTEQNCFSYRIGETARMLPATPELEAKLEAWAAVKVAPHAAGRYRTFEAWCQPSEGPYFERILTQASASFGSRGAGHFYFCLRYKTLEALQALCGPGLEIREVK